MSHILIAGLGDLGRGLAENLLAAGHRVSGIRRGSDAPSGVDLYSQDLLDGARLLPPDRVDLLVIIMTPSEYSEEGYLKAYVPRAAQSARRAGRTAAPATDSVRLQQRRVRRPGRRCGRDHTAGADPL